MNDTDVPSRVHGLEVAFVAGIAAILALFIATTGWVPILDSANLAFHEAGHPIVGLFSDRLMVYGGTIFQLLLPLVALVQLIRQGSQTGTAVCVVWLGDNVHNIARYMADARAQELPLVGGGEHDWTEIFARWGVLHLDTRIAGFVHLLGWLLMAGAVAWLYREWRRGLAEEGWHS